MYVNYSTDLRLLLGHPVDIIQNSIHCTFILFCVMHAWVRKCSRQCWSWCAVHLRALQQFILSFTRGSCWSCCPFHHNANFPSWPSWPVGSAFIWVHGSRGIKWWENPSLTNKFRGYYLVGNFIFQVWTKQSSSLRFRYRFENIFSLKSIWWFHCPGFRLDPDPHSSNFVDPDPQTINADPHHCISYYPRNLYPYKSYKWT